MGFEACPNDTCKRPEQKPEASTSACGTSRRMLQASRAQTQTSLNGCLSLQCTCCSASLPFSNLVWKKLRCTLPVPLSPSALALRYNSDYTSCSGYLRFGAVHGRKTPVAEAAAPRPTSGRAKSASFLWAALADSVSTCLSRCCPIHYLSEDPLHCKSLISGLATAFC